MKKILLLLVVFCSLTILRAQNLQLHNVMGKDHKYVFSHIEMFKPDKWGSNFFFIDLNYGEGGIHGMSTAYWEITRSLRFWKSPFAIHVEYDGGFGQFKTNAPLNGAFQINDAWLLGGEYTWNAKDFSKIFTLQMMYKNIRDKNSAAFQVTGVWTIQMLKNKLTFTGFADFWREDNFVGTLDMTEYVFLTKPQLWYNFTEHFSLGSECDISSNFSGNRGFMANPTAAAKWNF